MAKHTNTTDARVASTTAQIIPFPAQRIARDIPEALPNDATEIEEAVYRIRKNRAACDRFARDTRQYRMAAIALAWWEGELGRLMGHVAITDLRRLAAH